MIGAPQDSRIGTPLSASLATLAEIVGRGVETRSVPLSMAELYRRIVEARDAAIRLEARAGARGVAVSRMVEEVTNICAEAARFEERLIAAGHARVAAGSTTPGDRR